MSACAAAFKLRKYPIFCKGLDLDMNAAKQRQDFPKLSWNFGICSKYSIAQEIWLYRQELKVKLMHRHPCLFASPNAICVNNLTI
jgi:hypothetical protein